MNQSHTYVPTWESVVINHLNMFVSSSRMRFHKESCIEEIGVSFIEQSNREQQDSTS